MVEIRDRFTGKIIHSGDFANIKTLVLDAVEKGISLRYANLRGADLRWIRLEGADFSCANLNGANLSRSELTFTNFRHARVDNATLINTNFNFCDFIGANFSCSDFSKSTMLKVNVLSANFIQTDLTNSRLEGVNFSQTKLYNSNLTKATFRGCTGNRKEIKSLMISEVYPITYTSKYLQIGCECHEIVDWWKFSDRRIRLMDGVQALDFWTENKEFIKSTIEKYPATGTIYD